MDVDFSTEALFKLLEDKVLEIVLPRQFSGIREEDNAKRHQEKNEDKSKPKTGHTTPSGIRTRLGGILPDHSREIHQLSVLQRVFGRSTIRASRKHGSTDFHVSLPTQHDHDPVTRLFHFGVDQSRTLRS
jgi:hypothetical protein